VKTSCCSSDVATPETHPSGSAWRRVRSVASWILPGVILAAMPKCPVCVTAYVALFTGCGISLAAAGVARSLVVVGCIGFFAYLAVKSLGNVLSRRST
jgi:hypothetical protein